MLFCCFVVLLFCCFVVREIVDREEGLKKPEGDRPSGDVEKVNMEIEKVELELGENKGRSIKKVGVSLEELRGEREELSERLKNEFSRIPYSEEKCELWRAKLKRVQGIPDIQTVELDLDQKKKDRERLTLKKGGFKSGIEKYQKVKLNQYTSWGLEKLHLIEREWLVWNAEKVGKEAALNAIKTCDDHGYRDDCECCQRRLADVKMRDELRREVDILKEKMGVIENIGEFEKVREAVGVLEWREYVEVNRELEGVVKGIPELEKMIDMWNEVEKDREDMERSVVLHRERDELKARIAKYEKEIEELEEVLMKKVRLIELQELEESLNEWEEWDIWWKGRRARELEGRLEVVKEGIAKGQERIAIEKRVEEVSGALAVFGLYERHNEGVKALEGLKAEKAMLDARIVMLEERMREIEKRLKEDAERRRKIEEARAERKRAEKEIEDAVAIMERWKAMAESFKRMSEVMVGYKDWVLGENVIPGVVLKVNELLEKMCARHRVLTVAHDEVGGYGMVDGKNRVPIEKASGFQRFALSLAMRIVLGTYG